MIFFLFRLISYSKWKHVNTETQRFFTYSIEEKAWFTMSPILLQSINGVCFSLQVYHTIQDRKLSPIKMFLFLINIKIIKTFLSQLVQINNLNIKFYQNNLFLSTKLSDRVISLTIYTILVHQFQNTK